MYPPFEFFKEERNNEFLKQNKVRKKPVLSPPVRRVAAMIYFPSQKHDMASILGWRGR